MRLRWCDRARGFRLVAVLGVVALLAVACNGDDDDGGGDGADGGEEQPEEIDFTAGLTGEPVKVGTIYEGSNTVLANPEIPDGAMAGALFVNENGGIDGRPVEIVACDTGDDPNAAAECGRQMVEEGVVALTGVLSVHASEFMPLMEAEQIPSMAHVPAGVPGFTSPAAFPFSGGIVSSAPIIAQGLVEQGATSIGLARPDLAAGAAVAGLIEPGLENEGVPIANDVAVPEASADMAPFVEATLENDADAIEVLLSGVDATNFIIAARQADPEVRLGTLSTDIQGLRDALGSDLEGIVTTSSTTCEFDTPACEQADEAIEAAGFDPEEAALNRLTAYTGVVALAEIAGDLPELTAPALFAALNELDGLDIGIYPPLQFIEPAGALPRIFNLCGVPLEYDDEANTTPMFDSLYNPVDDVDCEWTGDAVELGDGSEPAEE